MSLTTDEFDFLCRFLDASSGTVKMRTIADKKVAEYLKEEHKSSLVWLKEHGQDESLHPKFKILTSYWLALRVLEIKSLRSDAVDTANRILEEFIK